jgi:two-component system sensor histidine kinase ChvG
MLDKTAATEALERNESEEAQELENFDVTVEGRRGFLHRFAPQRLASRIVLLNLLGLVILVTGILYFNQFRQGLIDARVQSLTTQAQIIAAAVAGSATADTGSIVINPDSLEDTTDPFAPADRFDNRFSNQSRNHRPRAAPPACQFNHPWADYRP